MAWTVETGHITYCPLCGRTLGTRVIEGREIPHCHDCDLTLYRNPVPMGRATVIDGDSALLIERGRGADIGKWVLPGGHIEYDESPRVGAARELEEETGLAVSQIYKADAPRSRKSRSDLLDTGNLRFPLT